MTDEINVPDGGTEADNDGQPDAAGSTVTGEQSSVPHVDDAESSPERPPFYDGEFKGVAIYRCPHCGRTARDRPTRSGSEQIVNHVVRFHRPPVKPTVEDRAKALGLKLGKG